jgi:hypothetical protein
MYSVDIKDALNNGISFDDLMHDFEDALEDAQDEIEKEKANTANKAGVDQCREDLMVALIAYLDAIGVLDVDTVSEEDMEKLEDILKNFENEMTKMLTIINMIVDNSDNDDAVSVDVKSNKAEVTDILADILAKLN